MLKSLTPSISWRVVSHAMHILLIMVALQSPTGSADWPMLGKDSTRNAVSPGKSPPIAWDVNSGRNIKWTATLGSMTHGTPVVAGGQVYIGTNNGAGYIERYPSSREKSVDLGCLLCFRESDGAFLWQLSVEKHPRGRVHDWPLQGLGGTPVVEGERLWVVTNRWEVLCLDTQGFRDKENDGAVVDEAAQGSQEANVLWRLSLIDDLGVFPHSAGMGPDRRCCPAIYQDRLYIVTGNGVDESHVNLPAPEAPSLVCLDKHTGNVLWTDHSPGANVLHTQVASPLVAEIAGKPQVIVPQGDGWVRAFDALTGELIWEFDLNFKESKWILGGEGTRNTILATPVLYRNRIYLASGQEAEHGEGPGRLVCIDPTKTGDISSELAIDSNGEPLPHRRNQAVDPTQGERAVPNPNSGLIWEFTRVGDDFEDEMHRTVSSVAIADGLLIAADTSGMVHCLDPENGRRHWSYDCFAGIWGGPLIVGEFVYVGDDDGDVAVFRLSDDPAVAMPKSNAGHEPLAEIQMGGPVYVSPIYANDTLYLATRDTLYAIAAEDEQLKRTENATGHWPQWFGPRRDNVSTETGLLREWPKEGPPLLWKATGLGNGLAPVSVVEERLYTVGNREDTEELIVLDSQTGRELWSSVIRDDVAEFRRMRWCNQRQPTVDEDRVYAVSAYGDLVCFDSVTGEERWRKNYVKDFAGVQPIYGYSDYPLVDGERLICTPNSADFLNVALDKRTGQVRWRSKAPGGGITGHSAIALSNAVGVRQYVQLTGNGLLSTRASDGGLLWHHDPDFANPAANIYTPITDSEFVFCANCYSKGCVLLKIHRRHSGWQADQVYQANFDFQYQHGSTIRLQDHVYAGLKDGTLACIRLASGELAWEQQDAFTGRAVSVTAADDMLYLRDQRGVMTLVEANPRQYSERGRFALPFPPKEPHYTYPVVADGRLYIRQDDTLLCYDISENGRWGARRAAAADIGVPASQSQPKRPRVGKNRGPDAIFVPTPQDVVEEMLKLAQVEQQDVVYDLGSGDGRIVIAAAKQFGTKSVGIEIDPQLVKLSTERVREQKLEKLVRIEHEDMFLTDLRDATVVTMFLYPRLIERLIPQFNKMPPGARIVSHHFALVDIPPEKVVRVQSEDSGEEHTLYLWKTPLKIDQPGDPCRPSTSRPAAKEPE